MCFYYRISAVFEMSGKQPRMKIRVDRETYELCEEVAKIKGCSIEEAIDEAFEHFIKTHNL